MGNIDIFKRDFQLRLCLFHYLGNLLQRPETHENFLRSPGSAIKYNVWLKSGKAVVLNI